MNDKNDKNIDELITKIANFLRSSNYPNRVFINESIIRQYIEEFLNKIK